MPIIFLLRFHENGLIRTDLGFHQLAFGNKGLGAFTHVQLSCICVKGTAFVFMVLICKIGMILPTGTNSLPKNAEFTICMNGSGFPLSKKMLCRSTRLPVTEDVTGKGCTGRMTSVGMEGSWELLGE